jgi:hypothetical protein
LFPDVPLLAPDVPDDDDEDDEDEVEDVDVSPDDDDVVSGPPVHALIVAAPAKTSAARVSPRAAPRSRSPPGSSWLSNNSAEQNGHEVSLTRT